MTCHFIVYNVGLGQCIGVLPHDNREYAMMIDCGHDNDFHPIDDFKRHLPSAQEEHQIPSLRSLVLTNYDHDHFSGLPRLCDSIKIKGILFPKNLSMDEVRNLKSDSTEALDALAHLRATYTAKATNHTPPYSRKVFSLQQMELAKSNIPIATNHLSQLVFISYANTTFCIPGDLETQSWNLMLAKPEVQALLKKTNILLAPHHGRLSGYNATIFNYCQPSCVILSDKSIVHETQKDMAALYASHVLGNGISFQSATGNVAQRKTLTTRNDGHILVTVSHTGLPEYKAYC